MTALLPPAAPSILNTTTSGMVYQRLGNTGLKVSRICLGCLTYGSPSPFAPVCNSNTLPPSQ
jgi:hypothetical protein